MRSRSLTNALAMLLCFFAGMFVTLVVEQNKRSLGAFFGFETELLPEGFFIETYTVGDECSDGVDNDDDTMVDGADPGCGMPRFESMGGPGSQGGDDDGGNPNDDQGNNDPCKDRVDNDLDGSIDEEDECDFVATSTGDEEEEADESECEDRVDNDLDGSIDGADPECANGDSES